MPKSVTKFGSVAEEQVQQPPTPGSWRRPFATEGCNMRQTEYAGNHPLPTTQTQTQPPPTHPFLRALPLLISGPAQLFREPKQDPDNFNVPR